MMVLFLLGMLIGLVLVEVVEIVSRRIQPAGVPARQLVDEPEPARWTALDDTQFERAVRDSWA